MSLRGFDAMSVLQGPRVTEAEGVFALRYVGLSGNPKCIRTPELESLVQAGVKVGFVYEWYEARAAEGFGSGRADALNVAEYMRDVLQLSDYPPVFYAVDADLTFAQVKPYFDGVNSVRKGGVYGSAQVVAGALDNNLATHAWQTAAWSHGVIESRAIVYQTGEQATLSNGVVVDINRAGSLEGWTYPGGHMAISGDDARTVMQAVMNEPFQMLGSDENGNPFPEGRNTDLRAVIQWFDSDILGIQRALKPMIQELLDRPAAGTVQLSPADLETIASNVAEKLREDILNGIQQGFYANKGQ